MLKVKLTATYFEFVHTIEDARKAVLQHIEYNELSPNTYNDCELFDSTGKKLGRFSYNGRFWPEREAAHE